MSDHNECDIKPDERYGDKFYRAGFAMRLTLANPCGHQPPSEYDDLARKHYWDGWVDAGHALAKIKPEEGRHA